MSTIADALDEFKRLIAPELHGQIRLSDPYYMVDCPARKAHWPPTGYGEVWSGGPWSGVYLIFDINDALLYVGKAVSIGTRLNAYFQGRDACKVVDTRLAEKVWGVLRCLPRGQHPRHWQHQSPDPLRGYPATG